MKHILTIFIILSILKFSYSKNFLIQPENNQTEEIKSAKTDSLLKEYNTTTDSLKSSVLIQLVLNYYFEEDFINTIYYGRKTLKNLELYPDNYAKSSAYELIGKSYYSMSLYSKALKYSSKALLISQELKDTNGIIVTLNDLGNIYDGIGEYDKSFIYYKKSIKLSSLKHDSINMAMIFNNFGVFYNQKGIYDSALFYYKKTKELKKRLHYLDAASDINIGSNYHDQGILDSAYIHLEMALNSKDINNKPYYKAIIYNNLAEIYLDINNIKEARRFNKKSQQIAQKKLYHDLNIDAYLISSKIYEKQLDYKKALNSYKLYSKINDSLTTATQDINISYMELLFDKEKKELEIEKYKTEQELKEFQINSYKRRQFFYILGAVVSLIAAIIFFLQKKSIIQSHKKIVDENVKSIDYKQQIIQLKKELPKKTQNKNINFSSDKYTDSTLSLEQKNEIAESITSIFDNDKIYLNKDLNLNELSEKIGINKTYISQVFSETLNIGFTEFVNQHRIDEAKLLLADKSNNKLTIEAIGENAGFKSSSTFNRVFKNTTGITPSFFKNNA